MPRLRGIYSQYRDRVTFLFVYILEAHASDEWPISSSRACPRGEPIHIKQTRSIPDRVEAAQMFATDFQIGMPVVLDHPSTNEFEKVYAPWPVRIYIIDPHGVLRYKAQPKEDMLELEDLKRHLDSLATPTTASSTSSS
eukprot:TRINITY_DN2086_c0_g1_i4.p1 TRINITY_DN2086_c0_g1~~TRINITY_DN2086_c0_g1_i4.p1  ORF type:complete len:139 (-),score=31.47 TRINITY_DN2086_c0_g1_i4:152-568(-)